MSERAITPRFPAILIGGPPHSGKSTLVYHLSAALRLRDAPHYVLRANPDGEGDWSAQAPEALVAALRAQARSDWSQTFAAQVAADIARRQLPLLVDAGGKLSPETEQLAAHCTHAVVLSADPAAAADWRDLAARHQLILLADLRSELAGAQQIDQFGPPLQGALTNLRRNGDPTGPCLQALIELVAQCCAWSADAVFQIHRAQVDEQLILHVERAIHPLTAHQHEGSWQPEHLPTLLASLPPETPLAIYGRGPGWLYAALTVFAAPAACLIFDVRQGWVELPLLLLGHRPGAQLLQWEIEQHQADTHVRFRIVGGYLSYAEALGTTAPFIDLERGVILSGKLPHWLMAGLARLYSSAIWVAWYQPQLEAAIVVASRTAAIPLGTRLPMTG